MLSPSDYHSYQRNYSTFLILFFSLFIYACGDSGSNVEPEPDPPTEDDPTFSEELDQRLSQIYDDNELAALSFSAMIDGEPFYTNSLGYANLESDIENSDQTAFLIASLSKIVTGTAIMQLQETGVLSIDDPVNDHLSFSVDHPFSASPITIRDLLTHSSTIIDMYYDPLLDEEYTFYGEDSPIELTQMMRDFLDTEGKHYSDSTFVDAEPGTYYEYSNLATALLGSVVEYESDMSFAEYCQVNIFDPLGMTDTGWLLSNIETTTLAMPYDEFDVAYGHYTFTDFPNGGLRTSINDFTRFMLIFMNNGSYDGVEILSSASVADMLTVQEGSIFEFDQQGLILYHEAIGDATYWGHSGSEKGSATLVVFDPESNVGAIYFSNKDIGDPFFSQMDEVIGDVFEFGK